MSNATEKLRAIKNRTLPSKILLSGFHPRPSQIINMVCDRCQLRVEAVEGSHRDRIIVYPRFIAEYLCFVYSLWSAYQLGAQFFGGRNHASISYGIKVIDGILNGDIVDKLPKCYGESTVVLIESLINEMFYEKVPGTNSTVEDKKLPASLSLGLLSSGV
jgi:hypothetical protein